MHVASSKDAELYSRSTEEQDSKKASKTEAERGNFSSYKKSQRQQFSSQIIERSVDTALEVHQQSIFIIDRCKPLICIYNSLLLY